ncbi:MFS transporter [Nocardia sp. CNY236]|uniref:MFS transporter n=1 Tax=Nocardia sp. CNY236 TaxID=1169152 RepID=UPI0004151589|nr:MFS transporter [Nocardia sp. CNY236]
MVRHETADDVGTERTGATASGVVLAVVCAAQFMVVLDISVVNVALPSIRDALQFDQVGQQWVVNAYLLAFAGFLLLGGRLADLYGRRRVFLSGLVMFCGASLVGGLANSAATLVAARAGQGLGAAVLAPATLTFLTATFPEGPTRTKALATWTAVGIAGGTAGNLIGGVLTEYLSWRSILLINVPIGVVAGLLTVRHVLADRPGRTRPRLDATGAVLATAGLGVLTFGIAEAADTGWTSTATIIGIVLGVVLLGAFAMVESRFAVSPLIPLRLFEMRSVSLGNLTMLLVGACLFPMWFFLTLSMQNVLGYSPAQTGVAFLPHTVVAIVVGARVTPWLMRLIDGRIVIAVGSVLAAAGFVWQAQLTADSAYLTGIFGPAIVFSIGNGLLNTPITTAATSGVSTTDAGAASGLINTARQVGGALGLAVLVTVAATPTSEAAALGSAYSRVFFVLAATMLGVAALALALPAGRDRK